MLNGLGWLVTGISEQLMNNLTSRQIPNTLPTSKRARRQVPNQVTAWRYEDACRCGLPVNPLFTNQTLLLPKIDLFASISIKIVLQKWAWSFTAVLSGFWNAIQKILLVQIKSWHCVFSIKIAEEEGLSPLKCFCWAVCALHPLYCALKSTGTKDPLAQKGKSWTDLWDILNLFNNHWHHEIHRAGCTFFSISLWFINFWTT